MYNNIINIYTKSNVHVHVCRAHQMLADSTTDELASLLYVLLQVSSADCQTTLTARQRIVLAVSLVMQLHVHVFK